MNFNKTLKKNTAFVFIVYLLSFFAFSDCLIAQKKITFEGIIKDKITGQNIKGASIFIAKSKLASITNDTGYFKFELPIGIYNLEIKHIGYDSTMQEINLNTNNFLEIYLLPKFHKIDEIVVTPTKKINNSLSYRIPISKVKSASYLLGEIDILKNLQKYPGISSVGEGNSSLIIRGGSLDQTAYFLDNSIIYRPTHLLGYLSVINTEIIENIDVYLGGNIPSNFGEQLAGIVKINTKQLNSPKKKINGGIGLLNANLSFETPLIENKLSFIVSARRSYLDIALKKLIEDMINGYNFSFYDIYGKIQYDPNKHNNVVFSLYHSNDNQINEPLDFNEKYNNTLCYLNLKNSRLNNVIALTSFNYSNYSYLYNLEEVNMIKPTWKSKIEEYKFEQKVNILLRSNSELEFGFIKKINLLSPFEIVSRKETKTYIDKQNMYSTSNIIYANTIFNNEKTSFTIGLRYNNYRNIGAYNLPIYEYKNNFDFNSIIDTIQFDFFEPIKIYTRLEPRLNFTYSPNKYIRMGLSYNRLHQFLQSLSNFTGTIPSERFLIADYYIKPQKSDQFELKFDGVFLNKTKLMLCFYYKKLKNQYVLKSGTDIYSEIYNESIVSKGQGKSKGIEFLLEKNFGKFKGNVSYTLSDTKKKIHGINNNKYFNPSYDIRHNFGTQMSFQFNKKLTINTAFIFRSGYAVTFPNGLYTFEDIKFLYYDPTQRNQDRMPCVHRLDFSLTYKLKSKYNSRFNHTLTIGINNVYVKKNANLVSFVEMTNNSRILLNNGKHIYDKNYISQMTSFFPFLPFISYNFSFS